MNNWKVWMVEYDFVETKYGRVIPKMLKMGFTAKDEAERWASENTVDGVVLGYE